MELIPIVGSVGFFTFSDPVTLDPKTSYTVEAVETFQSLAASGVDVKTVVYDVYGISPEVFQTERSKNVKIASLKTPNGNTYHVSCNFIAKYPDIGSVPYQYNIVSVALAQLPSDVNLVGLCDYIKAGVLDKTGVAGECIVSVIGNQIAVEADTHKQLEIVRANNIKVITTTESLLFRERVITAELQTRVHELEQIILNGYTPPVK